jgi:hypothetical protein
MDPPAEQYPHDDDDCIITTTTTTTTTESTHGHSTSSTTRPSPDNNNILENGETINDFSIHWLAHHLTQLTPSSGARNLEPAVLLQALQQNMGLRYELRVGPFLRSELVAHCVSRFYKNSLLLTRDLLHQLTTEELLPFISPAFEAPVLLLADCWLLAVATSSSSCSPPCWAQEQQQEQQQDDDSSNLSERCIQSITTYWKSCYDGFAMQGNDDPDDRLFQFIQELPSHVILQMISQTTSTTAVSKSLGLVVARNVSHDGDANAKNAAAELPFCKLLRLIQPLIVQGLEVSTSDEDESSVVTEEETVYTSDGDDDDDEDSSSLDDILSLLDERGMEQLHASLQILGLDDLWSDDHSRSRAFDV